MQPLSEEEKRRILAENPYATYDDLEEYEDLRSARFTVDPTQPQPFGLTSPADRLAELHKKIFGAMPETSEK